jgi:signal transduction histidine kinase
MRPETIILRAFLFASSEASQYWLTLCVAIWLGFVSWALWYRTRAHKLDLRRDRILREELEAYARLDASLPPGSDARALAKRICRVVSGKSAFHRAALLLRDPEDRLYVAASAGMDDFAVAALALWGNHVVDRERGAFPSGSPYPVAHEIVAGNGLGAKSLLLDIPARAPSGQDLPPHQSPIEPDQSRSLPTGPITFHDLDHRAILLPLRTSAGHLAGALAVSLDRHQIHPWSPTLDEAVAPLQTLAVKLTRSLENVALTQRLARAEKLAGLGQLAGGVAHELNNPLTAVLGFAELIAESSSDPRVREDARTISDQALRMRQIIQTLVEFWRPSPQENEPVQIASLLEQAASAHRPDLAQRQIQVILSIAANLPPIHGNPERLLLLLGHLVDNAALAIESIPTHTPDSGTTAAGAPAAGVQPPAIRLTASASPGSNPSTIHLVVSDTGPGFHEPARVFDPFYTTRQPGQGAGLGLSICYGIVREHGGEISAFNLHPHGAAVVIELPTSQTIDTHPTPQPALRQTT